MFYKGRLLSLLSFGLLINTIIIGKLYIYFISPPEQIKPIVPNLVKKTIFDRNYIPLAISSKFYSAYIDPFENYDPEKILETLEEKIPRLDFKRIKKQWSPKKHFIWLERYIQNPSEFEELGLPDIYVIEDVKRIYPQQEASGHAVGFVDVDQTGLSGIEYAYNKTLEKEDVIVTIDSRVQNALREVLSEGAEYYSAKGGSGIVLNANTGEIIAMISIPEFNPNDRTTVTSNTIFDSNTLGVYEFGSILKVANLAMILNTRKFKLTDQINIPTYLPYGRFKITDFGENIARNMPVLETFVKSSNKGNALLALEAGEEEQKAMFADLGYFSPINIKIPTAKSLYPKKWSKGTIITSSFGYGVAMTPLHMVRSLARIITGKKVELFLEKQNHQPEFEKFLPDTVVNDVQYALREVVENGYAKLANAKGMFVGAKTGTANIKVGNNYVKGNNITSCLGAFPLLSDNPSHAKADKYVFLISIHSPKISERTGPYAVGGRIAAPLVKKLVQKIGPILNIFGDSTE